MPISKKEFEQGRIDPRETQLEQQILDFLKKHPEDAFTLPEIQEGVSYGLPGISGGGAQMVRSTGASNSLFNTIVGGLASVAFLTLILNNLITRGSVNMRIIDGTRYYMIK